MNNPLNFLNLPTDIINIIFTKLNPSEAQELSKTCKTLNQIYLEIKKFNKYNKNINYKNIKKNIQEGNRYIEIKNKSYKVINILEYFTPHLNIMLENGYILYVGYKICLYNTKKNKKIEKKDIKFIIESKFKYQLKPIKLRIYNF